MRLDDFDSRAEALRQVIEVRSEDDGAGEEQPDIGAAVQAVNELRQAVQTSRQQVEERLSGELTRITGRIDQLETRLNRPGAGGGDEANGGGQEERRAFVAYCRSGEARLSAEEIRTLTVADDTTGGYLAPAQFVAEILKELAEVSPVRQAARVMNTSAPSVILPKRTGRISGGWTGELEEASETEPTFGQVEIPVHEQTAYIPVSNKLLEDNAVNLEQFLAAEFAEEFGVMEGAAFVLGNGVKKPRGLLEHPDVSYEPAGGSTLDADAIIKLFYALPARYRNRGAWLMNATTIGDIRQLKDGDGRYLWREPLGEQSPSTILGRPVIEAPDMPDVGSEKFPIIFGDFNAAYRIVDRVALSILRDPYTQAKKGVVVFHARRRVGGDVVRPAAVRKLKMSST